MTDAEIQRLVDERNAARAARDYAKADEIREQLLKENVRLYDSKHNTRWRRVTT